VLISVLCPDGSIYINGVVLLLRLPNGDSKLKLKKKEEFIFQDSNLGRILNRSNYERRHQYGEMDRAKQ
jgi:hypothetical protein